MYSVLFISYFIPNIDIVFFFIKCQLRIKLALFVTIIAELQSLFIQDWVQQTARFLHIVQNGWLNQTILFCFLLFLFCFLLVVNILVCSCSRFYLVQPNKQENLGGKYPYLLIILTVMSTDILLRLQEGGYLGY